MKRKLFTMGLIILSISAIGQYSSIYKNTSFFKKGRLLDESTVKNIKNLSSSGDTIWFENFSSGVMPAGWTEMDNTGNDFNWICTDQDPTGQYTSESAIASTSGGHFMLLNGDNYNTPLPATPVEMDAYFQTDAIDCSQSSSVVLRFQQYYRVCCNSWVADGGTMILSVYVSTDGVNWTEFDTHGQPTQNSSGYMSENYDQVEVNISSVAAQSASVYLRFHKKGASHYFWMIDDIVLMEAKEHDLVMEKGFANYHFIDGGYYTQIPSVQASSYWFSGLVYNNGAQDETNTSMLVNVNDGTSDVFTETADTSIFGSDGRDTLELDNYFELNQSATSYSVDMSIGSDNTDEDSTNNKISFDFAVSDTVFAHDISANSFISPSLYNSGSDGDLIGCQYWFNTDDTLGSVSVYIDSRSSENTSIRAEVYKYDSNLGELLLAIDSEEHIISTEDLGSWVTLPLTSEDGLQEYANADVMYYAMISCTWGNDTLWIGGDNVNHHMHNNQNETMLRIGAEWAYMADPMVPMVRLNLKRTPIDNAISEINNTTVKIFPNPTQDMLNISSSLYDASLRILDLTGKVALNEKISFNQKIDISNLTKGMYIVHIQSENSSYSEKLIVN